MITRLPDEFKQNIPDSGVFSLFGLLSGFKVNTVCQEARCPNISRCFSDKRVVFMILGDICTRSCLFCAVKKGGSDISAPDLNEPLRIKEAVAALNIKYAVVTSVTRDDLKDGGAGLFAETIESIRSLDNNIGIEVLIPDFCGNIKSLEKITLASPVVLAHNLETIARLYPVLRPQADYRRSLWILSKAKELNPGLITKSSLMLGLGEKEEEVVASLKDLRHNKIDIITLGQYLAPSIQHYPVKEFISLEQFVRYRKTALELGFKAVASGPLVRSSYQAQNLYRGIIPIKDA